MNKIIFLGASEFQIPIIKKAKEMEKYVGAVDISKTAPGLKYADECFECSIKDIDGIMAIAKKFKPDAITVGICDSAINTAAYVCKELDLPFHSIDVAKRATDKFAMIKAFKEHNVPAPGFMFVKKEDIEKTVVDMSFPLISKPIDAAGSKGINLIKSSDDLSWALKDSSNAGINGDILVEEMLIGPEVSVELVVSNGKAKAIQVTDKLTTGAPHFVEIGHSQPSHFAGAELESIKKVAESAAEAIGLYNSIGHAEIIITKDGPKMVEIGGRQGGGSIAEQLIELSTGISLSEIAIKQAFGEKIEIPVSKNINCSAIRFLKARAGTVCSIDGVEEARKIQNVKQVETMCEIGKSYKDGIDNSGRFAYVISSADTVSQAISACETALGKIKIELN